MVTFYRQHQIPNKENSNQYWYTNMVRITILACRLVLIPTNTLVIETEGPATLIPQPISGHDSEPV